MNKEEILERSRKENKDEGYENIINEVSKFAIPANLILCLFLSAFNIWLGKGYIVFFTFLFLNMTLIYYPKYKFCKNKENFINFIARLLIFIGYLVVYIVSELRKGNLI